MPGWYTFYEWSLHAKPLNTHRPLLVSALPYIIRNVSIILSAFGIPSNEQHMLGSGRKGKKGKEEIARREVSHNAEEIGPINRFDSLQKLNIVDSTSSDVLTTGNRSHVLGYASSSQRPRSPSPASPCFSLSHCRVRVSPFLSLRYEKSLSGAVNLQRVPAVRHYRRWLRGRNQFSSRRASPFSAPRGVWRYVSMLHKVRNPDAREREYGDAKPMKQRKRERGGECTRVTYADFIFHFAQFWTLIDKSVLWIK